MDTKSFGAFVSSTRKERGLTQAELANKLQITDKAVSRWERGIGFPDIGMLEPLSDALGVSVVELLQAKRLEEQVVSVDEVSNACRTTKRCKMAHGSRRPCGHQGKRCWNELYSSHRLVRKPGLLHCVDEPYQFLGSMG